MGRERGRDPVAEMAMTPMITHRIDHPSAWKGSSFKSKDDFSIDLEPRHLGALDAALGRARARGLATEAIAKSDFPLDDMQDLVDAVFDELMNGRGFVMLRGWPVGEYPLADLGAMYFGFGAHFGKAASQSVMGDLLGYVTDRSDENPDERAYRNRYALSLHTDLNDLIGMLNVRKAERGGESQYASAIAVHNEILATRPDLLPPLYEGFHYHRRGEQAPGQEPVTPHKVPVYSTVDGILSCRYVDTYMPAAAAALGVELPDALAEAIEYFEAVSARKDVCLDMSIEPGEMMFSNNFTVLHGRSGFDDGGKPLDQRRLFLRLWLDPEEALRRPHVPEVSVFDGDSIVRQQGRRPVYSDDAWQGIDEYVARKQAALGR